MTVVAHSRASAAPGGESTLGPRCPVREEAPRCRPGWLVAGTGTRGDLRPPLCLLRRDCPACCPSQRPRLPVMGLQGLSLRWAATGPDLRDKHSTEIPAVPCPGQQGGVSRHQDSPRICVPVSSQNKLQFSRWASSSSPVLLSGRVVT